MKSISFLKRLKNDRKLELVGGSELVSKSYIEKSESNLESAKILLENVKLGECVSLAYYSAYNMVIALLFKVGIKCDNHTGSIIILKGVFGIDKEYLLFAKKERIDKPYYADFHIAKEEVDEMITKVEDFNKKLFDFIEVLNNEKIDGFREKFGGLVG